MFRVAIMLLASVSICYSQMISFIDISKTELTQRIPIQEDIEIEEPLLEIHFKDGQDVTEYITTPEREKEAKIESNIMHFEEFLNSGNPLKPEFAEVVARDLSDLGCDLIIKDYDFDNENLNFVVEDINDNEFIIYLRFDENGNYVYSYSEKYKKLNENTIGNSIIFNEK